MQHGTPDRDMSLRVVGTDGEAVVEDAVPHEDGRIVIRTRREQRAENPGDRSSYTYQLEAFTALLRDGVAMPTDSDDAMQEYGSSTTCYRAAGFEPDPARHASPDPSSRSVQPRDA